MSMAAHGISSVNSRKISRGVTTALVSAVLEWLLIFMLFAEAIFSYFVTKFARYWELQAPCLLCSRLDHVLGNEKLGFYWELFCGNHKVEISSLVMCHVHNKLVDVHGICENCLFSFATINKSNAETYRLLVGKLGEDPTVGPDLDPLLEGHKLGSSSKRRCSCCNEPHISKEYAPKLFQTRSIGSQTGVLDVPLSCAVGHGLNDLKRRRDRPTGSVRASHVENNVIDPLSHVEYTGLKITSDTESEVLISDDDDAISLAPKEVYSGQCVQMEPCIMTFGDDFTSEKPIHLTSELEPSLQVSEAQPDISTSEASVVAIGHGLEELNWKQVESKVDPSSLTEFVSLDDVPPPSNATENPVQVSKESLDVMGTGKFGQASVIETEEIKVGSGPITNSVMGLETRSDTALQMPNYLDLGDAYRIAVSNRGRQLAGVLAEQWNVKDSTRVSEDLKLLLSQISAARGLDLSLNDTSPRVSGNSDGLKVSDASSSIGMQILQKRISLERNESSVKDSARVSEDLKLLISAARGMEFSLNDMSPRVSGNSDELKTSDASSTAGMHMLQKRISLERNESGLSLDGSIVSEIDGESLVERFKRQIEHDRKSMSALYKELEEERNASAVSANQAMAMITRLQEEKAALNMEASQYLRMMEEQAEYDMEALQKSNDILAEKEKEIQDLEAELEFFRKKFPHESLLENSVDPAFDLKLRDMGVEHSEASSIQGSASFSRNSVTEKPKRCRRIEGTDMFIGDINAGILKGSLLELEDERLYILRHLEELEKKLHLFSNNGVELANGEYFGNKGDSASSLKDLNFKVGYEENSEMEENDLSIKNDVTISKVISAHAPRHVSSAENSQIVGKENSEFDSGGQHSSIFCKEADLAALQNEVSNLNDRLKALDAERDFLEHTINLLRNGDEGLHFIQEIASHLQELKMSGIRKRDHTVA